jgi:hypothetical protein
VDPALQPGDESAALRAGNEAEATEAFQSYAERTLESAEIAQASELGFEACGAAPNSASARHCRKARLFGGAARARPFLALNDFS